MGQKCSTSECLTEVAEVNLKTLCLSAAFFAEAPSVQAARTASERSETPPPRASRASAHRLAGLDDLDQLPACDEAPQADELCQGSVPIHFERELPELASLSGKFAASEDLVAPYLFATGAVYEGHWKGNVRHGFGCQRWTDGAVYEGQWNLNKATGMGRFTHANGDVYIGEWRANKAHGCGTYCDAKGELTYNGEWRDDVQNGFGVEISVHRYEGTFRDGFKEGVGVYVWSDGSKYMGSWGNNCIHGLGIYVGHDGRWFKGRWNDSIMHGGGMYVWSDGREYIGEYSCDKKHGFGSYTWPDGRKYTGFWNNGRQHGDGVMVFANGSVNRCQWVDGRRKEIDMLETQNSGSSKEKNKSALKASSRLFSKDASSGGSSSTGHSTIRSLTD